MSVVEKSAPQRTIVGLVVVGVVAVLVLAIVVAFSVGGGSSSTAGKPTSSSTTRPVTTVVPTIAMMQRVAPIEIGFDRDATYRVYLQRTGSAGTVRVFAYIDPASSELRYIDGEQLVYGSIVGRFADMLVLKSTQLRVIDRAFATAPLPISGDDFVGSWHDHAIVAEYFPERTTFHEYGRDSRELRSVALVGRRPDVIGGVVGDSIIVERAGRIVRVGLSDGTVREFAVGNLIGVGGDRIYYTACTTQGTCTLNEAILSGILRTTPIGGLVDPQSGVVSARVAPDGSALLAHSYSLDADLLIEGGLATSFAPASPLENYTWAPTGRWVFRVNEETHLLEAIDSRTSVDAPVREPLTIPLPSEDRVSLQSVAVW